MLFKDKNITNNLPTNIALAVEELLYERQHSGIETTPDETAVLIETVFNHLGRLWIAETLHLSASNAEAFKLASESGILSWIFDLLVETTRSPLLGHWVAICRTLHGFFKDKKLSTVTQGLVDVDYGAWGKPNPEHRVSKLIKFRNKFAHGSYDSLVEDINHHFNLIQNIIAEIPGLWKQAIVGHVDGSWVRGNLKIEESAHTIQDGVQGHAYLVSADGSSNMPMYPMFYFQYADDQWDFHFGSIAKLKAEDLFKQEQMLSWMNRYQSERNGHLDSNKEILNFSGSALPVNIADSLAESLKDDTVNQYLIESHPGCGKTAAIAALLKAELPGAALNNFDQIIAFEVKEKDITQSGLTFLQFIFRQIEKLTDSPENTYGRNRKTLFSDLKSAQNTLKSSGKKLLIGLENLHLGQSVYRREELSVFDVYQALAASSVNIVATTHIGAIQKNIFYDHLFKMPIPEKVNTEKLKNAIHTYAPPGSLKRKIIAVLGELNTKTHLFEICNSLESQHQINVFEPSVEKSLWDLRPLLDMSRETREIEGKKERARLWKLFSNEVHSQMEGVK